MKFGKHTVGLSHREQEGVHVSHIIPADVSRGASEDPGSWGPRGSDVATPKGIGPQQKAALGRQMWGQSWNLAECSEPTALSGDPETVALWECRGIMTSVRDDHGTQEKEAVQVLRGRGSGKSDVSKHWEADDLDAALVSPCDRGPRGSPRPRKPGHPSFR